VVVERHELGQQLLCRRPRLERRIIPAAVLRAVQTLLARERDGSRAALELDGAPELERRGQLAPPQVERDLALGRVCELEFKRERERIDWPRDDVQQL
jgi:hypothetical protein